MPDDHDPTTEDAERANRFDLEPTRVKRGSGRRWVIVWIVAGCLVVSLAVAGNGLSMPWERAGQGRGRGPVDTGSRANGVTAAPGHRVDRLPRQRGAGLLRDRRQAPARPRDDEPEFEPESDDALDRVRRQGCRGTRPGDAALPYQWRLMITVGSIRLSSM